MRDDLSGDMLASSQHNLAFTPQPLRAVRVLFSPMASGWVGLRAAGKISVSQKP